jgi:hypothetical protein
MYLLNRTNPCGRAARVKFGRDGLQFGHLRFQEFVGDDHRLHGFAAVTAARGDCLIGRRFKAARIGLWIDMPLE